MLSKWFETEFVGILASMLEETLDEACLDDYDPEDFWRAAIVLCLDCSMGWKCTWIDAPGAEFTLDCPFCQAQHSAPVTSP